MYRPDSHLLLKTPSPRVAEDTWREQTESSISEKFSLPPDPRLWGSDVNPNTLEPDDHLHNPIDAQGENHADHVAFSLSGRAFANLGCLAFLLCALLALFLGYPIISYIRDEAESRTTYNLKGVNASGRVPSIGNLGLIDLDTPDDAYTKADWKHGKDWQLIFSDEFNTNGRSFFPGDDPYWEAADLHYWATNNMEWYSPEQITTEKGSLVITLAQKNSHDLDYEGGMVSTWNKFCFTGGLIESSVVLPGSNNIVGLWPALWAMGNLGRAGYGATLEGLWPYTYDACDVGTLPNQTLNGLPLAATNSGDEDANYALSYLGGQRLSRCTCEGESHPGPKHSDGTYVGRSAPEIDVFEAQVTGDPVEGQVSQSGQWAPFNKDYMWRNTSDNMIITDITQSFMNTYLGGKTQQATSVVTSTDPECYQNDGMCYSTYGFQYQPGFDDAYISWISDNKVAWTLNAAGMSADSDVEISDRPVPQEPLYIIANLGMSRNFGEVDLEHLVFPAKMYIDYIRIYQDPDRINVGCDPKDFPTQAYVNTYIDAYTNSNYTTWADDFKQPVPKNKLVDSC